MAPQYDPRDLIQSSLDHAAGGSVPMDGELAFHAVHIAPPCNRARVAGSSFVKQSFVDEEI
jgi:hypothetical protein